MTTRLYAEFFGEKFNVPVLAASRLVRWSIFLGSYDYDIDFRSTTDHANADMLSRLPLPDTCPPSNFNMLYVSQINQIPIDASSIREETQKDAELKAVLQCLESNSWDASKVHKAYYMRREELSLEDGVILWGLRVVILKVLQERILTELHYQHPGIVRMK